MSCIEIISKASKPKPTKSAVEEPGLFPVESIIGRRIVNGKVHFKIRWKGYSQTEDSWEPEENLADITDLIQEFRRKKVGKFKRSTKRKKRSKTKKIGKYEYVPRSELVASKTKFFDDVRDGKIDLTKNDMYSRVKTRKRLNFDLSEVESQCSSSATISTAGEFILDKSTYCFVSLNKEEIDRCDINEEGSCYDIYSADCENNCADSTATELDSEEVPSTTNTLISSQSCFLPKIVRLESDIPEHSPTSDFSVVEDIPSSSISSTSNSLTSSLQCNIPSTVSTVQFGSSLNNIVLNISSSVLSSLTTDNISKENISHSVCDNISSIISPTLSPINLEQHHQFLVKNSVSRRKSKRKRTGTDNTISSSIVSSRHSLLNHSEDNTRLHTSVSKRRRATEHTIKSTIRHLPKKCRLVKPKTVAVVSSHSCVSINTFNVSKSILSYKQHRPFVTSEKDLIRIYSNRLASLFSPIKTPVQPSWYKLTKPSMPSAEFSMETNNGWAPDKLPDLKVESDTVQCITDDDLVNAILCNRWNLLEKALNTGHFQLDCRDSRGIPPLIHAVLRNRVSMIRLLLEHGVSADSAQLEEVNCGGETCESEECRLDPSAPGRSALMCASELGHVHSAKALLDYGAFSDAKNQHGDTALHFAILNGRILLVQLLLDHGTNFYQVNPRSTAINLVNQVKSSGQVSPSILTRIYDLIYEHHTKLTSGMRYTVNQYLAKLNLRNLLVVLPCQWVSVMAGTHSVEVNVTPAVGLHTPVLLLVHGRQCGSEYHFWMEDGPCLIKHVILNDVTQISLREAPFVTTMHPLLSSQGVAVDGLVSPSFQSETSASKHFPTSVTSSNIVNRLVIEFETPQSAFDRQIRVAVLAIDVQSISIK